VCEAGVFWQHLLLLLLVGAAVVVSTIDSLCITAL
jgi:hypothetical protein